MMNAQKQINEFKYQIFSYYVIFPAIIYYGGCHWFKFAILLLSKKR